MKLHRVPRNVTGYGRGVVATQYAPLTTVFNPSVTFKLLPYILHGKTQERKGIVQACCIANILIDRKEIKKRGYIETMYPLFIERKTRLKLATLSLEG